MLAAASDIRLRLCVAAIVLVACALAIARDATNAVAQPHRAEISPAAIAAVGQSPSARIIVSLEISAAPGDHARRRNEIGAATASLRAAVPPTAFRPLRTYRSVPAITGDVTADGLARLAAHPLVRAVTLDAPLEFMLDQSKALIGAGQAHSLGVTGAGVLVAVLDSGAETDHPALAGDFAVQACFLIDGGCPTAPGVAGPCANGVISSAFAEDGNGHGTHVTGIITSDGNGSGQHAGIAPDAQIAAFKVVNDCGGGTFGNVLDALDAILTDHQDVDVINISLGTGTTHAPGTCEVEIPALTAAIASARSLGMTVFASSGNSTAKTGVTFPACIDDVVAVGAVYDAAFTNVLYANCFDPVAVADQVGCFSQAGDNLDLLAPGAGVTSTYHGGYLLLSGTSMSSPAAAAVAALVRQDEPSITPAALEQRLAYTGVPVTDPVSGLVRCRVDALKAVTYSAPLCGAPSFDTDGDGCADAEELALNPSGGGSRDPGDPWDFYDTNGGGSIDLSDTLLILSHFGHAAGADATDDVLDRYTPIPSQPWRTAESNDGVDLLDALANLQSFGHSCEAAP